MASELPVCVASQPVVSRRFPFRHGDETGTSLRSALSFSTAWPRDFLAARAELGLGEDCANQVNDCWANASGFLGGGVSGVWDLAVGAGAGEVRR
jgi:hypothetical protein